MRSVDLAVPAALLCDFSRVAVGLTTGPQEGGVPCNFGAVDVVGPNVVLCNILGAADGLTIVSCKCGVDQASVNPTTISWDDNDQRRRFWSVGAAVTPATISQDIRDEHLFGFVGISVAECWSVRATVFPTTIARNVQDAHFFNFAGISSAMAGPAAVSCKGIVNRMFMVI